MCKMLRLFIKQMVTSYILHGIGSYMRFIFFCFTVLCIDIALLLLFNKCYMNFDCSTYKALQVLMLSISIVCTTNIINLFEKINFNYIKELKSSHFSGII